VTLRRLALVAAVAAALPLAALVVAAALTPLPGELARAAPSASLLIEDRDGHRLREVRAEDGTRARWVPLAEVGETAVSAVLAAEDRRFYRHHGVDPVAVLRAAATDAAHLRVVSGASTITMQLARIVRPHPRTLRGKFTEMALALRIEWSLSKERVLEEYVNRASFGPNLRGIGAASEAVFDKRPQRLSAAEAALVAGLPRGPSLYDVSKRPELARRRRDRVLARMVDTGALTEDAAARAKGEPLVPQAQHPAFGAPHLVQGLVDGSLRSVQPGLAAAMAGPGAGGAGVARVRTTLDARLQRSAEAAVTNALAGLEAKHVTAAGAVVLDNETGDVLAWVGSPDVFDQERLGANDGVRALRQPGSTLKPFLYALAIEAHGFTPATALPDVELHVATAAGDYAPRDYDGHFRGPVRLRDALGSSLNVPAVWTAQQVGAAKILDRLHDLGFASLREAAEHYGPGLALGDGEVTLLELANAYATLARSGTWRPVRVVRSVETVQGAHVDLPGSAAAQERRVVPQPVADQITDVLRDPRARAASFGERTVLDFAFPVAAKTGTSKGYRDNWVLGYTREVTVAVWVGNFDGTPMSDVSGISGAGPLFHAVMEAAMRSRDPAPLAISGEAPRGALLRGGGWGEATPGVRRVEVCALSGGLAERDCPHRLAEWVSDDVELPTCTFHERVRVDRRNGLRAGARCAAEDVIEEVRERFPPEYAAWAAAAGRSTAPAEFSPLCPAEASDLAALERRAGPAGAATDGPRIVFPAPGSRFAIDPDRPRALQVLDVQVNAPAATRAVELVVDGRVVDKTRAPFVLHWTLTEGDHRLEARADGIAAQVVPVHVRGGEPLD